MRGKNFVFPDLRLLNASNIRQTFETNRKLLLFLKTIGQFGLQEETRYSLLLSVLEVDLNRELHQ